MSRMAVINANYLMTKLAPVFELAYPGPCMHECVLSGRKFKPKGVRTMDIAKRILDFGMYAPTVYFPLIVEEALMIEPTESETVDTLDRFVEVMRTIAREALEEPDTVKNAPHTTRSDGRTRGRRRARQGSGGGRRPVDGGGGRGARAPRMAGGALAARPGKDRAGPVRRRGGRGGGGVGVRGDLVLRPSGALMMWGSIGPFFVTSRFVLDAAGAEIDSPFLKRRRAWSEHQVVLPRSAGGDAVALRRSELARSRTVRCASCSAITGKPCGGA
jgi:hypothetical protein